MASAACFSIFFAAASRGLRKEATGGRGRTEKRPVDLFMGAGVVFPSLSKH